MSSADGRGPRPPRTGAVVFTAALLAGLAASGWAVSSAAAQTAAPVPAGPVAAGPVGTGTAGDATSPGQPDGPGGPGGPGAPATAAGPATTAAGTDVASATPSGSTALPACPPTLEGGPTGEAAAPTCGDSGLPASRPCDVSLPASRSCIAEGDRMVLLADQCDLNPNRSECHDLAAAIIACSPTFGAPGCEQATAIYLDVCSRAASTGACIAAGPGLRSFCAVTRADGCARLEPAGPARATDAAAPATPTATAPGTATPAPPAAAPPDDTTTPTQRSTAAAPAVIDVGVADTATAAGLVAGARLQPVAEPTGDPLGRAVAVVPDRVADERADAVGSARHRDAAMGAAVGAVGPDAITAGPPPPRAAPATTTAHDAAAARTGGQPIEAATATADGPPAVAAGATAAPAHPFDAGPAEPRSLSASPLSVVATRLAPGPGQAGGVDGLLVGFATAIGGLGGLCLVRRLLPLRSVRALRAHGAEVRPRCDRDAR